MYCIVDSKNKMVYKHSISSYRDAVYYKDQGKMVWQKEFEIIQYSKGSQQRVENNTIDNIMRNKKQNLTDKILS